MKLSDFGQLLTQPSPIVDLMDDLGEALNRNPNILLLGGGNPAMIPDAQQLFAKHFQALSQSASVLQQSLGVYQSSQGNEALLGLMTEYLQGQGWPVASENLAFVGGSQTALFILLNLFAGTDGSAKRKIALPLVPEYLGYRSQGLTAEHFTVTRPKVVRTGPNRFRYAIDFEQFYVDDDIGAVCVSRPTNPSANLLTDNEIEKLLQMCRSAGCPLIVDQAYGLPFPGVVYEPVDCSWKQGMINVLSWSKLGLPGLRGAMVVAEPDVIKLVVKVNTIMNLAGGSVGAEMMVRLIQSGDLASMVQRILPDFYQQQRDFLLASLDQALAGLPYRIHEPEGAFFVWLWLEGLPVSSQNLYERLKQKGVLIMAGESFFFGEEERWRHGRECIRLTYCQPQEVLTKAVEILSAELQQLYAAASIRKTPFSMVSDQID